MKPPGYGETQPRLDDDRLPVVLVILDGLGDRPIPELGGLTPAEAARTPHLDELARRGASGWHLPFGWGRAPTSEVSHWAMFGYANVPFPGRAVLEALGAGIEVPAGCALTHASLRTSRREGGQVWITGRARPDDAHEVAHLMADLELLFADRGMRLQPYGGQAEALLSAPGYQSADVTDSDPLFEELHPWMQPVATSPTGSPFGEALTDALLSAYDRLLAHPVNASRIGRGRPALDVLTTKWSGVVHDIPPFADQVGVPGAAVTGTRLYRGLAAALGLASVDLVALEDPAEDMAARLEAVDRLIGAGARFVHVHTKATDEAGHSKQPRAKRDVLEALDRGLAGLAGLADRAIIGVTGDHATPSTHGVLHTADPTPLLVVGPTVRPDRVVEFGERSAGDGWWGRVGADELLPLLFGLANRPALLGHRITPRPVTALADAPRPMTIAPGEP